MVDNNLTLNADKRYLLCIGKTMDSKLNGEKVQTTSQRDADLNNNNELNYVERIKVVHRKIAQNLQPLKFLKDSCHLDFYSYMEYIFSQFFDLFNQRSTPETNTHLGIYKTTQLTLK